MGSTSTREIIVTRRHEILEGNRRRVEREPDNPKAQYYLGLAYHIDLKHPMWNAAYLEQTARLLGDLGYNAVLLEVEDKLHFSAAAEIAAADALSPAEATELAAMFVRHGLEVIPLVQTLTFIFAVLIVLFNLIADVLYGVLDPRIRYD